MTLSPEHGGSDGDYVWRPITADDLEAWAVLLAGVEEVDRTNEHFSVVDLGEFLDDPQMDFTTGSIAAFDTAGSGEMAAYGMLSAGRPDPVHLCKAHGSVHPAHRGRGLGSALLDWSLRAVLPFHQDRFPGSPLSLLGYTPVQAPDAVKLFGDHGYQQARWFNGMTLDLAPEPPALGVPEGVVFRPFTPERSEDARLVRNEAFRDHWGSVERSRESWAWRVGSAGFRSGLTWLAYDVRRPDEPLGLVLGEESQEHLRSTGRRDLHVGLVATRRAGRRRGIASALLTHVLREARAAGFHSASLEVDSDSPTGATELYRRIGFVVRDTVVSQLLPVITEAQVATDAELGDAGSGDNPSTDRA
ncbi:GNAT family N-acetyltransferase [Streptacidiphilus sp. 4-A2]|nr:GNAT family N-acetyltransferase [Streptacidiphilus sp. 4-A2]